jgi:hypothetical protein
MCGFHSGAVDMHFHLNLPHFVIVGVHDASAINDFHTNKGND